MSPAGTLAPYVPHCTWVMFDLVEAAIRTGRRREAHAHVQAMREAHISEIPTRLALIETGAGALVAEDEHARPAFEAALSTTRRPTR